MKQLYIIFLLFHLGTYPVAAQESSMFRMTALSDTLFSATDNNNHAVNDDHPFEKSVRLKDNEKKRNTVFNAPCSGFIIPTVLISYGILAQNLNFMQQIDNKTYKAVSNHFSGRTHADDYVQYIPAMAVYGLDLMGIKAKHNWKDRTFLMASSYLISTLNVQTMKRTTKVIRPDESDFFSFPSGHTATAFVGAHLLFKEYKDTSPWIGIAGYTVASGTGVMRVCNRKHWVSDVVSGAGIGLLSVEISYLLLPVFHKLTGVKDARTSLVITPTFGNNHFGAGLAYTF